MEWAGEDNATEKTVDIAAAALFAAAVGFAAGAAGFGAVPTISAAVAGSVATFTVLRSVSASNRIYDLPAFELAPLEFAPEAVDELLLDDRLESGPPNARVVQLFGPGSRRSSAMSSDSPSPDASQALADALAELRRLLR